MSQVSRTRGIATLRQARHPKNHSEVVSRPSRSGVINTGIADRLARLFEKGHSASLETEPRDEVMDAAVYEINERSPSLWSCQPGKGTCEISILTDFFLGPFNIFGELVASNRKLPHQPIKRIGSRSGHGITR